jgi:hypothetical protein
MEVKTALMKEQHSKDIGNGRAARRVACLGYIGSQNRVDPHKVGHVRQGCIILLLDLLATLGLLLYEVFVLLRFGFRRISLRSLRHIVRYLMNKFYTMSRRRGI